MTIYIRDNLSLKVVINDIKQAKYTAIVIGSVLYYPKTFSGLSNDINIIYMDTRAFAVANGSMSDIHDLSSTDGLNVIISDIKHIKDSIINDKIILIGHSIHAFMALEYSRQYPEDVSHVILIGASPIVGSEIHQKANEYFSLHASEDRKNLMNYNMPKLHVDISFIDRMLLFGPMLWYQYDYHAAWLWKDVYLNPQWSKIIWGDMFAEYSTEQVLQSIYHDKIPVFLALGQHDYFNPPYLWNDYLSYSNITSHIFEYSGHTPQLEESQYFNEIIRSWLNTV